MIFEIIPWYLYRPDAVEVWRNESVKRRLWWYYRVMKDVKPAKFMIAKRIEVNEDPKKLDYDGLWNLHNEVAKVFREVFNKIEENKLDFEELPKPKINFLDVKIAIVNEMLKECIFCERKCKVNRAKGEKGYFCKLDYRTYAHSWFHHLGEESPLVPSGTIFYGSCNFKCVFCLDEDDYLLVRINKIISIKKVKEVAKTLKEAREVEVLTLSGWRKIDDIISRETDVIYEVVTNRGKRVKLTPEHIVIVQNNNELKEKYAKDLKVGEKLITLPCILLSKESIIENSISAINLIEEFDRKLPCDLKEKIRVKNVNKALRKLHKKYNISFKELFTKAGIKNFKYYWLRIDSIPLPEFIKLYRKYYSELSKYNETYMLSMKKGVKYYIPALINISKELMRLLGYFIAEGNYLREHGLVFTTSNRRIQQDILHCIKSIIPNLDGIKLLYNYRGKTPQIIVPSRLLYILFRYVLNIGRKAHNKSIPWIVFNVSKTFLKEFLSAYLTGDGTLSIGKKGVFYIRFVTTSERMAYELSYILGLNGVQYRIKERLPSVKYVLPTGHVSKHKQFWIDINGTFDILKLTEIAIFLDDRKEKMFKKLGLTKKMKKVRKADYVKEVRVIRRRKKVYDIVLRASNNVLDEHVFFAGNGILIHNCQNYDISQENIYGGVVVTPESLALIQKELRVKGAKNINHVGGDPTPNLHTIVNSLKFLDINVPQLWNSNMYLTNEAMDILVDLIDIWLPDFKYGNNKCALMLSSAPRYFEVVTRNLKAAIKYGDMIIRHLVLPNHLECCTKPILKWIAENLPKDKVLVNIMGQYRPEFKVLRTPEKWPDITRRPTYEEMAEAYDYARRLGIVFEPVS